MARHYGFADEELDFIPSTLHSAGCRPQPEMDVGG